MTEPQFPTLPSGAPFAAYPLKQSEHWRTITAEKESGHMEIRPAWSKPIRRWTLVGQYMRITDLDPIMGFVNERKGGGNFFYFTMPEPILIWSPYAAPTTGTTTSGAMDAHTVYVAFAYGDGTKQTLVSQEATQVVSANDLLTVTVPQLPTGVSQADVYYGTVSGTLYWVGSVSTTGGTYTEPFAVVNSDSASGQPVLKLSVTTNFESGQSILVGKGTVREEIKIIDTVQAGTSITFTENLDYTHTSVQNDEAHIAPDTGTSPETENGLTQEEVKMRILNDDITPTLVGTGVYTLSLDVEEMF